LATKSPKNTLASQKLVKFAKFADKNLE